MNRTLNHLLAVLAVVTLTTTALAGKPIKFGGFNPGNKTGGINIGNFNKKPAITIGNFNGPKPTTIGNHQQHQHQNFPKVQAHTIGTTNQQKLFKLNPTFVAKNYHTQFGVKKTFGYCYQGLQQQHWTYKCWVPTYGCHVYWDPCLSCYYYWCVPDNCWYPVTYCPYGKYVW